MKDTLIHKTPSKGAQFLNRKYRVPQKAQTKKKRLKTAMNTTMYADTFLYHRFKENEEKKKKK